MRDDLQLKVYPPRDRERGEAVIASAVPAAGLVELELPDGPLEVVVLSDSRAAPFFAAHSQVGLSVTSSWGAIFGEEAGYALLQLRLDGSGEELLLRFGLPEWVPLIDRAVERGLLAIGHGKRIIGLEPADDTSAILIALAVYLRRAA